MYSFFFSSMFLKKYNEIKITQKPTADEQTVKKRFIRNENRDRLKYAKLHTN